MQAAVGERRTAHFYPRDTAAGPLVAAGLAHAGRRMRQAGHAARLRELLSAWHMGGFPRASSANS